MNPFAELPTWVAVLVALFAAVVLIALNLGWLMAAKSMLDTQRKKDRERRTGTASSTGTTTETPGRDRGTPPDRTPVI
jgi:xanthine/uracil permease